MGTKWITLGDVQLCVDVDDGAPIGDPASASDKLIARGLEPTGLAERVVNAADDVRTLVQAVMTPVSEALASAAPDEWAIEFSIGFKGEAGIPYLTKGEANGSLKVKAKWTRA